MSASDLRTTESAERMPSTAPCLPKGWCWATPEELAAPDANSLAIGPFGSNLKVSDYAEDGVPLVFVRNIRSGEFHNASTRFVCASKAQELASHSVDGGDILITKMGDPPGDACLYPSSSPKAIITADCIKFRLHSRVGIAAFFVNAINSRIVREQVLAITRGVAQPKVSLGRFKNIWLPVAPTNEQRRIVAKIEELFSDLDAGVAGVERAKANLKRYRSAVLKAAIQGKLTEQWRAEHPDVEPAEHLLKRILADRRKKWEADQLAKYEQTGKQPPKGWKDKYKEPAPSDAAKLPRLPKGWCWVRVEQLLIANSCNGISVRGFDEPPGIPALRLSAMSDGDFDYSDRRYIPIDQSTAESLAVLPGDFFVARGNGSLHLVGRGTLAQSPPESIVFPDTMIRLRISLEGALREYVATVWRSGFVRQQIESTARTSAGIYKISQRDVDGFYLPLAPAEEQSTIVSEVSLLQSIIIATERALRTDQARAGRLRQAILKQAFEGNLVPQDPNDEPADKLLERITAERDAEQAASAKRSARGRRKTRARS